MPGKFSSTTFGAGADFPGIEPKCVLQKEISDKPVLRKDIPYKRIQNRNLSQASKST